MNWLDYLIVFIYSAGFLLLGNLFKSKKSKSEYFLGGKSFGWFPLSLSMMATQLSAISFISAPAFVGMRENGGMQWLSFEFGVPLAMIFLAGAAILYDTSAIMRDYPEDRYVGAALQLFASVALMFWYVLQLVMSMQSDD